MKRAGLLLLVMLHTGAPACATAAPMAKGRVAHAPQAPSAQVPSTQATDPRDPVIALDRAARSAESLDVAPDDALQRVTVQALLDLANATELQSSTEAATIRECAKRLERADQGSLAALDLAVVMEALVATRRALDQSAPASGRTQEYARAVATFRKATDALSADAPALERRAAIASAFRAASDALTLARGGEPTFAEADNVAQDAAPEDSLEARLEEARGEVLKLGQTRWVNARLASAQALQALADLVAAGAAGQQLEKPIATIRFNAERLRQKDASKFGDAGWIKAALVSTLDALDVIERGRQELISPWTRAARRAIAGIEERDSLAFQRAAVQDAFRATVDAFVFSTQSAQLSP